MDEQQLLQPQQTSPAQTPQYAPAPLSQEAYDSFVARTGVPLAPEAAKTLLPLLQKRKAEMIQQDLTDSATPTNKSLSKLDIFLHGQEDAMRHAAMRQKAEEDDRTSRWKSFTNAASQFSGMDPKTALGFQKEERQAANAAHKNDLTEQYHLAAQKTRDVLANGKIDFWNKQGSHLANQDAETALHHRALEEQSKWTRESINSLEQDKLKLDKYKTEIYGNRASDEIKFRAKKLQDEMAAKLVKVNAGINQFNVARQFELSKVNPRTGKPLYQDEQGNVPAYTPIPLIQPDQEQEAESSPMEPFPEMPQLGQGPPAAPQGMQAQAQALSPQAQMPQQGSPTSIGAMPINAVPNLPTANTLPPPPITGAISPNQRQHGNPPPPAASQLRPGIVPPPAAIMPTEAQANAGQGKSGVERKISSLKSSDAVKPQNRDKARDKYHQLLGQNMDPKAAFEQARKEFPY